MAFLPSAALPGLASAAAPAAPEAYRSTLPRRLQAARVGIMVLALVWAGLGFMALNGIETMTRVVGQDTAPSIVAAAKVRAGVAAAHADFADVILAGEGDDGVFMASMRQELRTAQAALVDAAQNITFGDEEKAPIRTILQGLGDYQQLVGQARASAGETRKALAFQADGVMHWTLLPAATALDRVNFDHLTETYAAYGHGWKHLLVLGLAALGLLLVLVWLQLDIGHSTRRILNPFLVGATLLAFGVTVYMVVTLLTAQSALKVAKQDAFDSVYALWGARAIAEDAGAAMGFYLLAHGDPQRQTRFAADFAGRARRLAGDDMTTAVQRARNAVPIPGFIGDELSNVTFEGERGAATAMLTAWADVMNIYTMVRGLEAGGRSDDAVKLKISAAPLGGASAALRFDLALGQVLDINDAAFRQSLARSDAATSGSAVVLLAALVAILICAWIGIKLRLDEYRF